MLSDAYHILANQLVKFKEYSHLERFNSRDAVAFSKLVSAITSLQETERRNAALLELSKLSHPELEALAGQAAHMLSGNTGNSEPDSED